MSSCGPSCTTADSVVRIRKMFIDFPFHDFYFHFRYHASSSILTFFTVREGIRFCGLSTVSWRQGIQFLACVLMIFASAFNYIILYLHVGGSFAFLSLSFINSPILFLTYPELSEFYLGGHGFVLRVFTLSSWVLCFASINSLHKVHVAHNDGLSLFECRSMQGLPCSVTTCLYNATVLE